jgi:hypothetical protein
MAPHFPIDHLAEMAVDAARLSGRSLSLAAREVLLASALATAIATLLVALGPPAGDGAAHLYRTELVREGAIVWDALWYGGHYPLASYSLLFYLPAALVGPTLVALIAAIASAALFATLAVREWGEAACWPARTFAVLVCASLFTGTYAYAAGIAAALGSLVLIQRGRLWLALACAALAAGFSPLAFGFLCLVLLAAAIVKRPPFRPLAGFAIGLALVGAMLVTIAALFPAEGRYDFRGRELAWALVACGLVATIAWRARRGRVLCAVCLLLGGACVLAYFVDSPIGSNLTRFRAYVFPFALLAATLVAFRPRWLTFPALIAACFYSLSPYLAVATQLTDTRPATETFWTSTVDVIRDRAGPDFRVDVVPTFDNWEAYHVAAAGIPIARGWYRQLDLARNPLLYDTKLNGPQYRAWLRSLGVKLVVLPLAPLDRVGAEPQASLLRSGRSGLVQVARTAEAVVYEVPNATPILTGPGAVRLTAFDHELIAGEVGSSGRYVLRVPYTPFLAVRAGSVCLERGAAGMTTLVARRGGSFELGVPGAGELARIAFGARPSAC